MEPRNTTSTYYVHLATGIGCLLSILLMTSCATRVPVSKIVADPENIAQLIRMTTVDAIQEVETAIQDAKRQNTQFLAPQHYSVANKTLNEAKQLLQRDAPHDKVVAKAAVARTVIHNAKRVKKNIETLLNSELHLKHSLETNQADKVYSHEYNSLVARLEKIVHDIENGKQEQTLPKRADLINDLQQLEIRSILHSALREPEEIMKRVKYRGGEKLAPLTYQDAKDVITRAKHVIQNNPHDTNTVEQMSRQALFATKRTLYVVEEIVALNHKVATSPEQVVLDEEYRLQRIARALASQDTRNNSLEVQSELIAKTATELKARNSQSKQDSEALEQSLTRLKKTHQQLTVAQQTVNELADEKNIWLAKETLLSAKVDQLESKNKLSQDKITITAEQLESKNRLGQDASTIIITQLELANKQHEATLAKLNQQLRDLHSQLQMKNQSLAALQQSALAAITRTPEPSQPLEHNNHKPNSSPTTLQQPRQAPSKTTTNKTSKLDENESFAQLDGED